MKSKQYQNKVKQTLQDTKLPPTAKAFIRVISEQKANKESVKEITLKEVSTCGSRTACHSGEKAKDNPSTK